MDAIDELAGITPGSPLDTVRRRKPVTRDNAQASFDALFTPANDLADMSAAERAVVAYFVAGLHGDTASLDFYRTRFADGAETAGREAVDREIARAAATGPYGRFPAGKLSAEDAPGPEFTISEPSRTVLGPRLTAALEHVHMLVFHPRDAAPAHMRALEAAAWSPTGIVTLSQLVAFLSFQLRAAFGLRALSRT